MTSSTYLSSTFGHRGSWAAVGRTLQADDRRHHRACATSQEYPKLFSLLIEAEEQSEIAESFDIKSVPTFTILRVRPSLDSLPLFASLESRHDAIIRGCWFWHGKPPTRHFVYITYMITFFLLII